MNRMFVQLLLGSKSWTSCKQPQLLKNAADDQNIIITKLSIDVYRSCFKETLLRPF